MKQLLALIALVMASTSVSAALVKNGTFTTDTATGLDWLDLTQTDGMSYQSVYSQLGPGGSFEGWEFAEPGQIASLFDSGGGTGPYDGVNPANDGVAAALLSLWAPGYAYDVIYFFNAVGGGPGLYDQQYYGALGIASGAGTSLLVSDYCCIDQATATSGIASALVRSTIVPVPAAVWLFTSCLGLLGWRASRD